MKLPWPISEGGGETDVGLLDGGVSVGDGETVLLPLPIPINAVAGGGETEPLVRVLEWARWEGGGDWTRLSRGGGDWELRRLRSFSSSVCSSWKRSGVED
jgi:hypothetical protein